MLNIHRALAFTSASLAAGQSLVLAPPCSFGVPPHNVPRLTGIYSTPFPDGVPGPYVNARVTRGDGGQEFHELRALLDTGADITLIPQITIDALGLQLVTDDLELHDGMGQVTEDAKMFRADIKIGDLPVHTVGISSTAAAVMFIGRDVLADYLAAFHGPGQSFSMDRPD